MNKDGRKNRVKRLKIEFVSILLCLLILPWIFVTVLKVRNNRLLENARTNEQLIGEYLSEIEVLSMTETEAEQEPQKEETDAKETVTSPKRIVEELSEEEIAALKLSEEELYDGYRKVYLTFDDGPSSNTDEILDILSEYNVKATFFVIYKEGQENEELYRRITDEGHTLGMHSCNHVYSNLYQSKEAFLEDTYKLRNFLYMVTGVETWVYRFPGGSSNKVSHLDMHTFTKALKEEGMVYFDWNVSARDASSPILSKAAIVRNATAGLSELNEAVILFHDTGSKVTTVEALPEIIEYIRSMDNTVILPITKETNPIQHISVE